MLKKLVFVFLFLFLVSFVNAEVIVDKLIVSTPKYSPEHSDFLPELGLYEYEVSWSGIPAADIYLRVDKEGLRYKLESKVETYSAIDLFYKLRYQAHGLISAVDYLPIQTEITQRENSKYKNTSIQFFPDGSVKSSHQRKGRETLELAFDPKNQMLDPFSAAFIARSLDWEPGTVRHFDTFNGKSRYLISFAAVDKIEMEVNDKLRPVWVVEPRVKKISTKEDPGKLRKAQIFITADEKREILKISSEVFIGSVKTRLVSFRPATQTTRTLAYEF